MKFNKEELINILLIFTTIALVFIVKGFERGFITHLIFIIIGIIDTIISIRALKQKEFSMGIFYCMLTIFVFTTILKDIFS